MKMKNNNTILYLIIAILSVFTIVLNVYVLCITIENDRQAPTPNNGSNENHNSQNNNESNNTSNENENNVISKLDNTKDWVYDAEYKKNVNADSYSTSYNTYYAKDIVVPFININSSYATISNNEIKNVFNDAIKAYNKGIIDKMTYVDTCNYNKYINNDVLSVLLTFGIGATDIVHPNYYIYNIDLKTGEKLSYKDVYTVAGFYSNDINTKVEKAITDVMKEELNDLKDPNKDTGDGRYYPEGTNFDTYNNESITNYKKSISDNTLKYFLSNDKKLNIIVRLSVPAGMGYVDKVITIG